MLNFPTHLKDICSILNELKIFEHLEKESLFRKVNNFHIMRGGKNKWALKTWKQFPAPQNCPQTWK